MNYNTVFAPTARAERFFEAHAANFPTYLLIAAVIVLTGIRAALEFAYDQFERVPEYRLMLKVAKIRFYRRVVGVAIRVETARVRFGLTQTRLVAAMDRVFCLN